MTQPKSFAFQTEFAPDGQVIGGAGARYVPREEADALAAAARTEAEKAARQSAIARSMSTLERIEAQLVPALDALERIAEALRREAGELAMIAARKIAGSALDAFGSDSASAAIAETVRELKSGARIVVTVAPDAQAAIEERVAALAGEADRQRIIFRTDPSQRTGDWRVEWEHGAAAFSRSAVEAELEAVISRRLNDPVDLSPAFSKAS
jgi:flagellar assembly protein FliH